jgi:hypothetical protein
MTTSLRDTARLTVAAALDPAFANRRVSIVGSRLSPAALARALTAASGHAYTVTKVKMAPRPVKPMASSVLARRAPSPPFPPAVQVKTLEEAREAMDSGGKEAFTSFMLYHVALGTFARGFSEPFLVDTSAVWGWVPEDFEATAKRVLASGH